MTKHKQLAIDCAAVFFTFVCSACALLILLAMLNDASRATINNIAFVAMLSGFIGTGAIYEGYDSRSKKRVQVAAPISEPPLYSDPMIYPAVVLPATAQSIVYFVQDVSVTGYIKIGRTSTGERRIMHFGVTLPFATRLVHYIECSDPVALESYLHYTFAHKRKRGEWFALSQRDMSHLMQIKGVTND